jgi:DNA-binding response OmpR family regulator
MSEPTVLIIDDRTELRDLLESILPYSGYRTIGASTGQEGLDLLLELKPDVVLLDLELPDTSGLKVLEELNRQELDIPTIMITGYGSEGVAARALRLGAQSYLVKPFTTEEVLSSVDRALTVRHLRHEKAQLAALLEAYTRHFRTISAVGRALIDGLDPDQYFQRIVEAGLYVTRAESCLLSLLEPDRSQLRVIAARGRASLAGLSVPSQAGDHRLRRVLRDGASVRIDASPDVPIVLQTGDTVRAVLQVPLRARDCIIGLLSVDRQGTGVPFGKHDQLMLGLLADYAVIAMGGPAQVEIVAPTHPGSQHA